MKRVPCGPKAKALIALALSVCLGLSSCAGALAAFQATDVGVVTLKAVAGDKEVILAWNDVDADRYNLYRATTRGGEGEVPYKAGLTRAELRSGRDGALTFTDKGLTNGTTYYYEVEPILRQASRRSNEVSATPRGGGGGGGIGKALLIAAMLIAVAALAKNSSRPKSNDTALAEKITEKAREAKWEADKTVTGVVGVGKITFTPADLSAIRSERELEEGRIIGFLQTEVQGDETKLPPGNYHLYLAKRNSKDKSDKRWHVYAEADGKIVSEAVRVRVNVTELGPAAGEKALPELVPQGWCWWQRDYVPFLKRWVWILHCW